MTYTKDYMGERLQGLLPYTFHFDLIPDETRKSGSRFVSAFESMVNDLMNLKPYKSKKIKKISIKGVTMTNKIIAHCWKCFKNFELNMAKLDEVFCPYCNMTHLCGKKGTKFNHFWRR